MTVETPSPVVPKLRFPEFRYAEEWKTKILRDQGHFLSSLTGKTAKDFKSGDATFIPYMNVFSNAFINTADLCSVNVTDDESQNAVAKGDVFFTVSSETPGEAGMSSVLLEDISKCYLNSFCALFRFDEGKSPDPVYLGYLLRTAMAREHLSRGAQGATRYNISRATFYSLPIMIPSTPEQRKIADCLGSLDDLIAAEGRKLKTLQQHKQGLMQQLFPQPGETVPRLRFPEFVNLPGWQSMQLSDLLNYEQPGKYIVKNTCYQNVGTPVLTPNKSFILGHTNETEGIYHNVPVIIFDDFTTDAKYVDFPFKVKSSAIKILKSRGDNELKLVYELMSRIRFDPTQHKRYFISQYQHLEIPLPGKAEQQKVADCLGSLDNLIAAESQKIESLQQHKQGLMQQIFPSLETK